MDRLTSMAVFAKAVDLGSFTAAGHALGMTSQMVGKHVGFLEQRLGTELLRRTTRRQSLTANGQVFYERCRTILAETEAAEALVRDLGSTPRGRLRISAPVLFGSVCLAPLVFAYARRHPHVDIELILDDRYVDLVGERFDIAVRLGALRDSTLRARPLPPHRLIVCAAPAYLEARGVPSTPADLVSHTCLCFVFSTGQTLSEWQFDKNGKSQTIDVVGRFRTNDARTLLDATIAGEGIALLSERVARRSMAAGELTPVLSDYAAPTRPMHLLFSGSRYELPTLRLFIDDILAALDP